MERNFAAVMSELRHARGLSQRKVAADLKISQALLSHYENGARGWRSCAGRAITTA